tara:strand:+ start:2475 stop:2765 length:291 start_codon:yes stop_codon:yes gene_type:complete
MLWHYEDLYNFFEEKKDDAVCLIVADVHNATGEPYAILHWVQEVNEGPYREYEVTETMPAVGAEEFDNWDGVRKLVRLAFANDVPVYQVRRGRLEA